jgi:pimeloyl-ACP methyl ester carboxylesterase
VTPDALAAELDTPAKRRRYIAGMYGHRLWASPGTFTEADVDFMTEPFATEERMRAGWAAYQLAHGRGVSEPPILDRKVGVPTLILYGMDDHVVGPDFVPTCEVAFTDRTGPVVLPGAGHFLQWERADLFTCWSSPISAICVFATGDRHGATLSASTLMYRVLGGRRPRP